MIRCSDGLVTDRVFKNPPSREDLESALGKSLILHGHRRGVLREIFATYVEVELCEGEKREESEAMRLTAILTEDELMEILLAKVLESPGHVQTGAEQIQFEGRGEVINPDDPRHPKYRP